MLCLWHWVDHVYHINPFTSAKKMIKPPKNPGGKSWICPCWGKNASVAWSKKNIGLYMIIWGTVIPIIPSFGEFMPSWNLIQPLLGPPWVTLMPSRFKLFRTTRSSSWPHVSLRKNEAEPTEKQKKKHSCLSLLRLFVCFIAYFPWHQFWNYGYG